MATAPQDHKKKGDGYQFVAAGKTYTLPALSEEAAESLPGEVTYAAIMRPDDDMAQLRLALATLEAAKPTDAAMKALRSLSTKEMLEVVAAWMGKAGSSS